MRLEDHELPRILAIAAAIQAGARQGDTIDIDGDTFVLTDADFRKATHDDILTELQRDSEWAARKANPRAVITHSRPGGVPTTSTHVAEGDGVCDFCGTREPAMCEYPCSDFEVAELVGGRTLMHRMRGAWMACGACQGHIEGNEWGELAKRSCATLKAKVPDLDEGTFMAYALVLHRNFQRHRL